MPIIVCKFQMFSANQTVYVYNDNYIMDMEKVSTEDLEKTILIFCDKYGAEEVRLYGLKNYLLPVAEQIQYYNAMLYNKTNVKVEVNPDV